MTLNYSHYLYKTPYIKFSPETVKNVSKFGKKKKQQT